MIGAGVPLDYLRTPAADPTELHGLRITAVSVHDYWVSSKHSSQSISAGLGTGFVHRLDDEGSAADIGVFAARTDGRPETPNEPAMRVVRALGCASQICGSIILVGRGPAGGGLTHLTPRQIALVTALTAAGARLAESVPTG